MPTDPFASLQLAAAVQPDGTPMTSGEAARPSGRRPGRQAGAPPSPPRARQPARAPLYERLATQLRTDIANGRLHPGDRLPTEAELVARHGISRVPVRQALDVLRQEGLIERFAGRGTFVAQPESQRWSLRSVEDLARLGTETELRIIDWRETVPAPFAQAFFGPACKLTFRLRAVRARDGVPVFYMQAFMAAELGRALTRTQLLQASQIDLFEHTLGLKVEQAREEIFATLASHADAARLDLPVGSPLLGQEVRLLGANGTPLQISSGVWRADAFRRCYELTRG